MSSTHETSALEALKRDRGILIESIHALISEREEVEGEIAIKETELQEIDEDIIETANDEAQKAAESEGLEQCNKALMSHNYSVVAMIYRALSTAIYTTEPSILDKVTIEERVFTSKRELRNQRMVVGDILLDMEKKHED